MSRTSHEVLALGATVASTFKVGVIVARLRTFMA
jgi:hypothetical protein